jgi:hypothetical protein
MAVVATLPPPPVRTRGLLTSAAVLLGDGNFDSTLDRSRWPMEGITFSPWTFDLPEADESNCEATYDKQPGEVGDLVTQPGFLLWRSLACTGLSGFRANLQARLRYSLDDLVSASIAAELETGAASGGIGLVGDVTYSPTQVGSGGLTLLEAFVYLEGFLAGALNGGRGTIHLTAGLYALAVSLSLVDADGLSPTGHSVVGDAGHSGTVQPFGLAAPGVDERWVYATSTVFYDLTAVEPTPEGVDAETYDFTRNVDQPLAERLGIVVFDPNVLGAALVDITDATV